MSNQKHYVGNGRQKQGSEYIILNLKLEDLWVAPMTETNGKFTIKVVVARMRVQDKFGRTHTAYVPVEEDLQEKRLNALLDQQEEESRHAR